MSLLCLLLFAYLFQLTPAFEPNAGQDNEAILMIENDFVNDFDPNGKARDPIRFGKRNAYFGNNLSRMIAERQEIERLRKTFKPSPKNSLSSGVTCFSLTPQLKGSPIEIPERFLFKTNMNDNQVKNKQ